MAHYLGFVFDVNAFRRNHVAPTNGFGFATDSHFASASTAIERAHKSVINFRGHFINAMRDQLAIANIAGTITPAEELFEGHFVFDADLETPKPQWEMQKLVRVTFDGAMGKMLRATKFSDPQQVSDLRGMLQTRFVEVRGVEHEANPMRGEVPEYKNNAIGISHTLIERIQEAAPKFGKWAEVPMELRTKNVARVEAEAPAAIAT